MLHGDSLINREHGIRAILATLLAASLLAPFGCMRTIGSDQSSANSSMFGGSRQTAAGTASSRPASPDAIRIGTEQLNPEDIWYFDRADLIEKAAELPPRDLRQYVEQRAAALIRDKITEMLLYQRATAKANPRIESALDQLVDAEIRKTVTEDFGGIQRRYEIHLESKGISLDRLRDKIRRDLTIAGFLEAEIKPTIVEPSRTDLVRAYEAYKQRNSGPQRRRMSLIDIRIMDRLGKDVVEPTREQWAEAKSDARRRAEQAVNELNGGTPFAEVAGKYSDGLNAVDGGAWDWISRGSVRERFEPAVEALYQLSKGQVSSIIETKDAYFIVRCDDIEGGETPDFMTIQPELKDNYYRNMFNKLVAERVEELRRNANLDPARLERYYAAAVNAGMEIASTPIFGPLAP
jgi:hypothetical protein